MKKIISIVLLFVFAMGFAQVSVSSLKEQVDGSYKGGQEKFNKDLAANLQGSVSANGMVLVNFAVDENKKVQIVKIYPELGKGFEYEMKRAITRMSKKFNTSVEAIDVKLDFVLPDMTGYNRPSQTANDDPFRFAQQSR